MAEQLFQIGIKAIIRDTQGKILLTHIPEWEGIPAHWDMPGGRMDAGEGMQQTLRRELREEVGVDFAGEGKQLMAFLTAITIPVGDTRIPLVFVVFEVRISDVGTIRLSTDTREDDLAWFTPAAEAKELSVKCPPEFCELVRKL